MRKLYNFDKCSKVGDNFAVYFNRNQDPKALRKSIEAQAYRFIKVYGLGQKFTVTIESEPVPCIRVTRVQ